MRLIVVGHDPGGDRRLLFADAIETTLRSPAIVAVDAGHRGLGLLVAEWVGSQARGEDSLGYGEALAIGVAQAAALVPGVSRSGATLTVALLLGPAAGSGRALRVSPEPAGGARGGGEGRLELAKVGVAGLPVTLFVVGLVVSAVVGYLTVKYFIRYLAGHSLHGLCIYRFALAAVTVVWLLARRG